MTTCTVAGEVSLLGGRMGGRYTLIYTLWLSLTPPLTPPHSIAAKATAHVWITTGCPP